MFISDIFVQVNSCIRVIAVTIDDSRNFPNYYYPLKQTIPGTDATVEVVMMDTVTLCGNTGDDRLHTQPRGPENVEFAEQQWDFVEKSLQESKYGT